MNKNINELCDIWIADRQKTREATFIEVKEELSKEYYNSMSKLNQELGQQVRDGQYLEAQDTLRQIITKANAMIDGLDFKGLTFEPLTPKEVNAHFNRGD